MICMESKKIIKLMISIILFISYAFIQATYLHAEFKYWYSPFIYLIIFLLPWVTELRVYTPQILRNYLQEDGLNRRFFITGLLWGIIGFWFIPRNISGSTSVEFWIQKFPDAIQILLSLPSYLLVKLGLLKFFQGGCTEACFHMLVLLPLFILISGIFGGIIFYLVSKIYLKLRK